jgi:hypothetical protein
MSNYYRENELDILSSCREIQQIGAHNLNLEFTADDRLNITVDRERLGLATAIQTEFKCFQCPAAALTAASAAAQQKLSQFRDECEVNCFVASSSNDYIVVAASRSTASSVAQSAKLKLLIRQRLNDRELTRSTVFVYLNQERHSAVNANPAAKVNGMSISILNDKTRTSGVKSVLCERLSKIEGQSGRRESPPTSTISFLNKNGGGGQCMNVSVNLAAELTALFAKHDLVNKIKSTHMFQARVYALLANNDYQLLPGNGFQQSSGINMNSNNQNEQIVKLNPVDSMEIKNFIFNASHYPILVCNVNEGDRLKIELSFRNKFDTTASLSDASATASLNDWRSFEVYTIDVRLNEVCNFARDGMSSNADGLGNYPLDLLTLMSLGNNPNPLSLGATSGNIKSGEGNAAAAAAASLKFNVFLPVLLSFVFVLFFILTAVFIRRYRLNGCIFNDRKYACEKHLSKSCVQFFKGGPILMS